MISTRSKYNSVDLIQFFSVDHVAYLFQFIVINTPPKMSNLAMYMVDREYNYPRYNQSLFVPMELLLSLFIK
ncbi:hypothetical protein ACI8B_30239 [Acinetobacter proteolyticus]|uniref:Uncharacterized protein n=1 Tax=Acinetobacter proteolyticus TaxID=1776741 RepID=A0A653K779_9GAMM|nr:hypothetical protein ACI8B_30239 [Acinetobacter proteolyticus]